MRYSLAARMLAAYALLVLPLAAGGVVLDVAARAASEREVREADAVLARVVARDLEARIQSARQAVEHLARLSAVRNVDRVLLEQVAESAKAARIDIDLFYILDAKGKMIFSVPSSPNTMGADFSFRKYYRDAVSSPGAVVSDGRVSPTTDRPVATVAMAMRDSLGRVTGVMCTNLSLLELGKAIQGAGGGAGSRGIRLAVVDASRQVLACSEPGAVLARADTVVPGYDPEAAGAGGSHLVRAADGRQWLLSYSAVPGTGWTVVVQHPVAEAFAAWRYFHLGLLAVLAFLAAGGCLFWFSLARGVLSPVGFMSAVVRGRAGWGDAAAASLLARGDEMGELARSLRSMQAEYGRRMEQLGCLAETSRTLLSSLDTGQVLDTVLAGLHRLARITACAVLAPAAGGSGVVVRASRVLPGAGDPGFPQPERVPLALSPGTPVDLALDLSLDPPAKGSPGRGADGGGPGAVPGVREAEVDGGRLLVVPVHPRYTDLSALAVLREGPEPYAPEEVNLVRHFAHHAAMAFERLALYERALARERSRLEAIVESMSEGLVLEDCSGVILYANPAASRVLGTPAAGLVGRSFRELLAASGAVRVEAPAEEGRGGAAERYRLGGTAAREVSVRSFEVLDGGSPVGRGHLVRDVTHETALQRMSSNLVSTVAHELRTPLATIKGYASTLLQEDVKWDRDLEKRFLRFIHDEVTELAGLVNSLLDLSRVQSGTLRLEADWCRLADLVERALARLGGVMGDHMVCVDLPEDLPLLYVDGRRIEQVIRNLVENALKYSVPGGEVRVSARVSGGAVEVSVADRGPGISPEHLDRIFEPFYKVDGDLYRQQGGAGLGLAICRGVVEAHGGRIWVRSGPRGSTFTFSLPLGEGHPARGRPERDAGGGW